MRNTRYDCKLIIMVFFANYLACRISCPGYSSNPPIMWWMSNPFLSGHLDFTGISPILEVLHYHLDLPCLRYLNLSKISATCATARLYQQHECCLFLGIKVYLSLFSLALSFKQSSATLYLRSPRFGQIFLTCRPVALLNHCSFFLTAPRFLPLEFRFAYIPEAAADSSAIDDTFCVIPYPACIYLITGTSGCTCHCLMQSSPIIMLAHVPMSRVCVWIKAFDYCFQALYKGVMPQKQSRSSSEVVDNSHSILFEEAGRAEGAAGRPVEYHNIGIEVS